MILMGLMIIGTAIMQTSIGAKVLAYLERREACM